ncbi:alpha/beta fold hydrolase [Nonomuraea sp. NPDC049714]|uniref:alpha/beta fold hydrolase n=1 Tax=Nonomuraea sp. NPDC049714 TaxID=3364357 RepID=UPI0037B752EA
MGMVRSCDGTAIAFRRYGAGPAIVLVGGAAERLALLLSTGFTVYRPDRRGFGDSGDTAPYAVAREVEDLDAVIDAAGGSVSMAGLGSGAVLALEAARLLPGITRLALHGPTLRPRPDTPDRLLTHLTTPARSGAPCTGFAATRWSCVSVPTLILDEHPIGTGPGGSPDDWTDDWTDGSTDGEKLAALLPDGRHRTVPHLEPAALARRLAEFFRTSTRPPCRRSLRRLPVW